MLQSGWKGADIKKKEVDAKGLYLCKLEFTLSQQTAFNLFLFFMSKG